MKRILVAAALIAVSTSVLADPNKWRSPYTGAPGGTPISPLDAEKQAPVEKRELEAWRTAGHHWHLPRFHTAGAPRP
jgi:hypothetical protein